MAMRYPIGVQTFEKIIKGNFAYVDKTDLVYQLAQENVCFLSRPRRFGKSLLISTLEAYFLGRRELFQGLMMESLEKDWDVYPVFHIDFANGNFHDNNGLTDTLNGYLSSWEKLYGKDEDKKTLGDRFRYVLEQAYAITGKQAVVLIDEYDMPLLDVLGEEQERENRNILKSFYGTFKAADASLRFVFLTGVTKFSQVSVFSGFNQANDISMNSEYDAICGITENELHTVFAESIREIAVKTKCSVEEVKSKLKNTYDGYHFSPEMLDIYNPFSLINAFFQKRITDYWFQSGTPTYLKKLMEENESNLMQMVSQKYRAAFFVDFRADSEDPLAMLYQSGYLTIKEYEPKNDTYRLDFPNNEVKNGFVPLVCSSYFRNTEREVHGWAGRLESLFESCDLDGIRDAFTSFLSSIPYTANKDERAMNFESHYQYTFYLINRMLGSYVTLIEKQNSAGRADIIVETEKDVFIFEFKLDGSADDALKQIEEKQYALSYLNDPRNMHKIGVNVSSSTRTVSEWKVAQADKENILENGV